MDTGFVMPCATAIKAIVYSKEAFDTRVGKKDGGHNENRRNRQN
jgi:hypothetical protein